VSVVAHLGTSLIAEEARKDRETHAKMPQKTKKVAGGTGSIFLALPCRRLSRS
jgi:hypothetical protein